MRSKALSKIWDVVTRSNWRLVKTVELSVRYTGSNGKIYFHCYENQRNKRRIELSSTLTMYYGDTLESIVSKTEMYNSRIRRWLDGRYDPDIPRYSDIPAEETANALKGTI